LCAIKVTCECTRTHAHARTRTRTRTREWRQTAHCAQVEQLHKRLGDRSPLSTAVTVCMSHAASHCAQSRNLSERVPACCQYIAFDVCISNTRAMCVEILLRLFACDRITARKHMHACMPSTCACRSVQRGRHCAQQRDHDHRAAAPRSDARSQQVPLLYSTSNLMMWS
jgi:hypothetical protein